MTTTEPDHRGIYPPQDEEADGGKVVVANKGDRHRLYNESRAKRDEFVALIEEGLTIKAACKQVGVLVGTYEKWRGRWPQFAAQVDVARANSPGVADREWTGDFASFRRKFFKMTSPWFHVEVINALEQAPRGSITLILLPPEHGKTTLLEDWCCYKLATDPSHRIGYASEKQAHSVKALARVKMRMEDDSQFRTFVAHFGPFSPRTGDERVKKVKGSQPWGATYFDVYKKGDFDERDYSLAALGIGAAVAGSRFDTLLIDDVQSLKSLNLTDKIVETIRQDWLSRPGTTGKTIIVGTRVGDDDVYAQLMDLERPDGSPFLFRVIKHPAIDHNDNALWPERYTREDYEVMRGNVGPSAWARNYQQSPQVLGETTFEREVIDNAKDPMRSFVMDPPVGPHWQGIALSVDPALGGQSVVQAAAYGQAQMMVLDTVGDYGFSRVEQILGRIEQMCRDWSGRGLPITTLVVEEMAFQRALANDERLKEIQREFGFAILPHQTGHNKNDPLLGVASMALAFRRQEIVLPGATDTLTVARFQPLEAELLKWRPVRGTKLKMDRVMSLWFIWLWWRQRRGSMGAPTTIKTQGLPWAPTQRPSGLLVPSGMKR